MTVCWSPAAMRPNHKCPVCFQDFSRKWNMREHCRTQHGFDPIPGSKSGGRHGFSFQNKRATEEVSSPKLKEALERFARVTDSFFRLESLAKGEAPPQNFSSNLAHPYVLLNHFMDNYLFIKTSHISGISGYFCGKCLTFNFEVIKDIGADLIAFESHGCPTNKVHEIRKMVYADRKKKEMEVLDEVVDTMTNLVKEVFGDRIYVTVEPFNDQGVLENFHSLAFQIDELDNTHWLWKYIQKRTSLLTEIGLRNYIRRLESTYGLFTVKKGENQGTHLAYLHG